MLYQSLPPHLARARVCAVRNQWESMVSGLIRHSNARDALTMHLLFFFAISARNVEKMS